MRTSLAFLLAAAFAVPVGASAAGPRKQAPVDAFKPVYVLTSTAQARLLPSPGKTLALRTDKVGRRLALLELKQHQVDELSAAIHDREDRCGGFFAFESRAEAEQFLQADQTAAVMDGKLGPFNEPLRIDNGAVVAPALAQVDAQHIANMIWTLSTSYPNRYYASINGTNAALAIRDYWMGLAGGRTDVSSEMVGCATCGVLFLKMPRGNSFMRLPCVFALRVEVHFYSPLF